MIFKRRNNSTNDDAATGDEQVQDTDSVAAGNEQGPFDLEDAPEHGHYIDLGALKIEPVEGMQLRLEVEEGSQRVIAAALELDGSRLQLQVFAAPKSSGLWEGISSQIEESIGEQNGKIDRVEGRFGTELVARVPADGPDGEQGYMVARFIGIDGGRWFLRAVVGGPATLDRAQAERLEDRLARVVVERGDQPMPPQELLPLTMPAGAVTRSATDTDEETEEKTDTSSERSLQGRPERGPEITEIG
ncbi:MAG: DUF3710 domain-containing protein [Arthrobacter sp.]|uniref:DUF3710 domain-containing protein n=1 Tax=unclassified Arthrobacter TaxID=235627 RepID=UPI00264EE06A|nr:DUF3710 domain-containing protein [Micrococcaceae bacterium]MDN5823454.1 DUF3710 domain-containing protein [Micrococcaceae bacterium]MDN5879079.1 DUF3710 domain-containing protein [Micrococcaceae bacterium]MDN5887593.1 DUF3710 domain-containing protein [Micrococcaceae bacterium]MDN5904346.1 DUF3710 domain-containing protein [Micrococcaceae bacterium]